MVCFEETTTCFLIQEIKITGTANGWKIYQNTEQTSPGVRQEGKR